MDKYVDKFWLKSYPEGVATEIDYTQYQSLVQLLEERLKAHRINPGEE